MLQVCLKGSEKQKSWYLDNGCSRHMTGDRSLFLTLTMKEGGTVGFGGNQTGKIISSGTIGNSSISINNVWLVDGLKHNLLQKQLELEAALRDQAALIAQLMNQQPKP